MTDTIAAAPAGTAAAEYLSRAKALAPLIEAEAAESERTQRVTPTVGQALADANLFWMLVPTSLGGGGLTVTEYIEVVEEVTRADGSTGWVLMIVALGNRNGSLYLGARDELWGNSKKSIICGFSAPVGTGRFVDGGIVIGAPRVPFGSGSDFATHLCLAARMLDENGAPILTADGQPEVRSGYIPIERINLLGGWDVSGMIATGSGDYEVPEQFVPEDLMMPPFWVEPTKPTPGEHLDRSSSGGAGHCAVVLGLMKRALQEVARLTDGKGRQGYPVPVDEHALFRAGFAEHEAQYRAARAYVLEVFGEAEATARTHGEVPAEMVARIRQATTHAHTVAQAVIGFCDLWGGTQSFKGGGALNRCIRDFAVAKNHLYVDPISMVDAAPSIIQSWR